MHSSQRMPSPGVALSAAVTRLSDPSEQVPSPTNIRRDWAIAQLERRAPFGVSRVAVQAAADEAIA